MTVMQLPTKFGANSSIQFRVIHIFRNPRWRQPPSWIFESWKFGTFRHVNSVVLGLHIKYGSDIGYCHWDWHTYAPDVHLMTSHELTSGFVFSSCGHLRMAVAHLPTNFGVIDIFPKFKMEAAAILDFQVMWVWPFPHVDSVVLELCTKFGSNICYNHWVMLQTFIWWRHAN